MTTPTRSPLCTRVNNDNVPQPSPISAKLSAEPFSQLDSIEDTIAPLSPQDPFPPSTPTDDEVAPPPPPATKVEAPASVVDTVRSVALPILTNEHRLTMPIWVGGNMVAAMSYLVDLNLTNTAAWLLLGCVMKGFAVSVVSTPVAAPAPLSVEDLQPYLAHFVNGVNTARDVGSSIFLCNDPRLSFRVALVLYAATLVTAHASPLQISLLAFNMAFVVPAVLKSGALFKGAQLAKEKAAVALTHPKMQEVMQQVKEHPQLRELAALLQKVYTPKAKIVGAFALWFFYLSWFNKLLSLAFGCLYLKSQGAITTKTEMQVGEAVDQIKKRARRMSIGAGAMLSRAKAD